MAASPFRVISIQRRHGLAGNGCVPNLRKTKGLIRRLRAVWGSERSVERHGIQARTVQKTLSHGDSRDNKQDRFAVGWGQAVCQWTPVLTPVARVFGVGAHGVRSYCTTSGQGVRKDFSRHGHTPDPAAISTYRVKPRRAWRLTRASTREAFQSASNGIQQIA